jgi:N-acetylmuramoyl-L-alanine amidase
VEIGFMTNETEEKLLADPVYQGKVAWAVYAGIVKYFAQGGVPALGASEKDKVIKTFKEQAPGSISEP